MLATAKQVFAGDARWAIAASRWEDYLPTLPSQSVDLVFGSPPYEAKKRSYGIDFSLRGQEWVDWMARCVRQCLRVCRGLVAFVIDGHGAQDYSCVPEMLVADLKRDGVIVRKKILYERAGIFGGGGQARQHAAAGGSADWLVNRYEEIVCFTSTKGKLPWADTLATGAPPKYPPGGAPSHRKRDGSRVNAGKKDRGGYKPPRIANPGNIVSCKVGRGHMGDDLCHRNEAPFPELLAEFMVRSFCPEHGIVLDPFLGSGTTLKMALKWYRRGLGCDTRASQVEIARLRLDRARDMFAQADYQRLQALAAAL